MSRNIFCLAETECGTAKKYNIILRKEQTHIAAVGKENLATMSKQDDRKQMMSRMRTSKQKSQAQRSKLQPPVYNGAAFRKGYSV